MCKDLQPILTYYPGLDNFDNRTSLFYSINSVDETKFVSNAAEVTEIAWIPIEKCLRMVRSGEILDALTVSGLLGYQCFSQVA